MSPESVSSVFPDRLIHPLPKRRLRERLSPDVAESIQYPPAQATRSPLFYYPYSAKDEVSGAEQTSIVGRAGPASPPTVTTASGSGTESSAVVPATRQTNLAVTRSRRGSKDSGLPVSTRTARLASRSIPPSRLLNPFPTENHQTVPSAASSMDGYESFENTNNKKKRKIPTASDIPHSSTYSFADLHSATSGSSPTHTNDDGLGGSPSSTSYSGPASFVSGSPGLSGPGRGRYGRSRSSRAPLHPLPDARNTWTGRVRRLSWLEDCEAPTSNNTGRAATISTKHPSREQENTGYSAHQASRAKPNPTEFTFTCTSRVPGNLLWPGSDPRSSPNAAYWGKARRRGSEVLDMGAVLSSEPAHETESISSTRANASPHTSSSSQAKHGRRKKGRNKLSLELEQQARERRRQQQEQNELNPPADGVIYICPFCEFENISGYKPRFLVRSFEMKERQKRLEAERRQRLLEKAKARGRKNRKSSRAGVAPSNKNDTYGDSHPSEEASVAGGSGGGDDDDTYDGDGDGYQASAEGDGNQTSVEPDSDPMSRKNVTESSLRSRTKRLLGLAGVD